ncbi:MAG: hypothetical protein V4611_01405 [Patescibacteria group bacterium]
MNTASETTTGNKLSSGLMKKPISRRQALVVGAWAAPVLTLTIAAPAAAASGPTPPAPGTGARLVYDTWRNNWTYDGAGHVTGVRTGIQIQNRYHADDSYQVVSQAVTDIYVLVTYAAGVINGGTPAPTLTGSGWSYDTASLNSDGSVVYTLHWHGVLTASSSTPELNISLLATKVEGAQASTNAFALNAPVVSGPSYGNTIY